MIFEIINVDSYSGTRSDERPIKFTYRDQEWEIAEIIDRWHERGLNIKSPVYDYFKVRTTNKKVFILRYNPRFDSWAVLIS